LAPKLTHSDHALILMKHPNSKIIDDYVDDMIINMKDRKN